MIFELYSVILMTVGAIGQEYYTSNSNEYLLGELNSILNPYVGNLGLDGPTSISNAPTPMNQNQLPTLEQMNYYMYYAGSTYYGYDLHNLSCEYCLKYRDDVDSHKVVQNDSSNTLSIVALSQKRKEIVVAFRGAYNIWGTILCFQTMSARNTKSPDDNVRIHQGFYNATMSLYPDVVRQIGEYRNTCPDCKIVIAGHSLGGAMARITYFFLEDLKEFPSVTYELYTYGEPRAGNKYLADFMNRQPILSARVVAKADIVSHVPPTSILGTKLLGSYYIHPQTEYWINGKEDQNFCNRTVAEDPKCSISVGPAYSFADHGIYFDVNLGSVIAQPTFAYLPFGILDPVEDIPPLPKPIETSTGDTAQQVLGAASPLLG